MSLNRKNIEMAIELNKETTNYLLRKVKNGGHEGAQARSVLEAAGVNVNKKMRDPEFSNVQKRDVGTKEREALADKGDAMPDGSYPIANVADLKNAIQAYGRASDPEAVKAHIKRRAKELGVTDLIPENW